MSLELELDPELMAGQMVVGRFPGRELPGEVREALARGRLSGVVLFQDNLGPPDQVRDLTDALREAAALPPIIALDHEGGRVQRLAEPFTAWPPLRRLGELDDSRHARAVAAAMAEELAAVGVNVNLAPVLDVDSNPENPVIGDRSFSPEAHAVARLGAAMIEGFREAGLASCGKHFPGHGDTSLDSHLDLPVAEADRIMLDRRELVPFAEAIVARVPLIMTAHVKATALDPYYPATISRAILYDLLREELGFDGVIVSDDLAMAALAKYMPLADAAFSAVRAGADLVLVCSGLEPALEAGAAIAEALKRGVLDFGEATRSVRRILAFKQNWLMKPPLPRSVIPELIGCDRHRELARK